MKALIQRVKSASVTINNELYSEIGSGLLVFVGVEKADGHENAEKLADKILKLRIFEDENEKMNLSVSDVKGEILVVSQFTLCGDCKKGTRPSFDNSAPLDKAVELYEYFAVLNIVLPSVIPNKLHISFLFASLSSQSKIILFPSLFTYFPA